MKILIATTNQHKIKEYKKMFSNDNVEIYSIKDLNTNIEIEENGKTFQENALIKAKALIPYAKDMIIIADDSGLIIDALPNILNVHTSRYLSDLPYKQRCENILKLLEKVEEDKRSARFVCNIVLITNNHIESFEGVCHGHIAHEFLDSNHFGYDPIFIPDGYNTTFAQLDEDEKNKISHRGLAFKKLTNYLKELK